MMLTNPECVSGKHLNCNGDGFNDATGEVTERGCPCRCHVRTGTYITPGKGEAPYDPPTVRYRQATPDDVEQRLYQLGREVDSASVAITKAEAEYLHAKTAYELAYARAYIDARGTNAEQRKSFAVLSCEPERHALTAAEAGVKAMRENARRIYSHVDLARSVSVIVRAGIGAS